MVRLLYSLVYTLLLPAILLRLYWRGRKAPEYRDRVAERFGCFPAPSFAHAPIWLHCVSVGETIAAAPLIRKLQQQHADIPLVVTTMTPTGSERVRALFGDAVFHVYAPYDAPFCIAAFLKRIQPRLLVVLETELWPNWIFHCQRQGTPVVLANARLSAKSAAGYARLKSLSAAMLAGLSKVAAQSAADAERFQALGLPAAASTVTGSIKFDISLDDDLRARARALRSAWCEDEERLIVLAASTHAGEDELILQAFAKLLKRQSNSLLVLVPRHPERFARVAELCREQGFSLARRSTQVAEPAQSALQGQQVLLGDTMGELMLLYGCADIVIMGGTLVASGGHNFLEPAAWGLPMLSGNSLFNFAEISELLIEAGALTIANNADELAASLCRLATDRGLRECAGQAAAEVLAARRGALAALLRLIDEQLALTE